MLHSIILNYLYLLLSIKVLKILILHKILIRYYHRLDHAFHTGQQPAAYQ